MRHRDRTSASRASRHHRDDGDRLVRGPAPGAVFSRRRRFTGRLRRAIEVRDRTCQHASGCDVPAVYCDADHVVPYSQGGVTSESTGRLLCSVHNRNRDLWDPPPHLRNLPTPAHSRPATGTGPDRQHDIAEVAARQHCLDRLDMVRARLRWQILHEPPDPDDLDDIDGIDDTPSPPTWSGRGQPPGTQGQWR